jgi:hypothetical protein
VGLWNGSSPLDVGLDGLIWAVPSTPESQYAMFGDQPSYVEYHYRGFDLIGGNLYVLTGLGLFTLLVVMAVRLTRQIGESSA